MPAPTPPSAGSMNRRDFFFGQSVQQDELDAAFQYVDDRIKALFVDDGSYGVVGNPYATPPCNLEITEDSPKSLYVKCAVGIANMPNGGRAVRTSNVTKINCAVDKDGNNTIPGSGNERYVSIFILPDFTESDPRIDDGGYSVNHILEISHRFEVVAGSEVTAGSAVPPALRTDAVLLADVLLGNATTQISNAAGTPGTGDIDLSRKEVFVRRSPIVQVDSFAKFKANLGNDSADDISQIYRDTLPIAWVCFDGTPGTPTIKCKHNVANVTKDATGTYRVYLADGLLASANSGFLVGNAGATLASVRASPYSPSPNNYFAVAVTQEDATAVDGAHISCVIFGQPTL